MTDTIDHPSQAFDELDKLHLLLGDIDGRIDRQRKRIERAQATATVVRLVRGKDGIAPLLSPPATVGMRALLLELLETRRFLAGKIRELQDRAKERPSA